MHESWVPAPIAWPEDVLQPGHAGWETSLTRWLDQQLPGDTWRHHALAENPWAATAWAAVGIQHHLAGMRTHYRQAGQWRGLIGPDATRALQDAITAEATRLKAVLEQLILIEYRLTPKGAPPQADLGMRSDVRGGP